MVLGMASKVSNMLSFTKMHSLGNDFVLFDGVRRPFHLDRDHIQNLADRHRGIGCDQLIVAEVGQNGADFAMRIFNSDGSEAEQCGNGARCFAKFLHDEELTDQTRLVVDTGSRLIQLEIEDDWQVVVDMGAPGFEPAVLPFDAQNQAIVYKLEVADEMVEISAVSLGNPHAVLLVDDVDAAPVDRLGPAIERHPRFPDRTNVGFVCPVSRSKIRLRVWERGVGETLACGSGACAAAVVCYRLGRINEETEVELPGGTSWVRWPGQGPVFLRGPAVTVYRGEIDSKAIGA
jgi:diaminopimelate epimerase